MKGKVWRVLKVAGSELVKAVLILAFMMAFYTVAYLITYQKMPRWK